MALGSQAHFLAVAEHRLIPARARTVTAQLRQAGISLQFGSFHVQGEHAGVAVVSLHGAHLSLPSTVTPSLSFFDWAEP